MYQPGSWLQVSLARQQLDLLDQQDRLLARFAISTASAGAGERQGSGCTPRGWHRIAVRIGQGLDQRAVLQGRLPTGEIWTPALAQAFPQRDWILGRILWLDGLQPGVNHGGQQDSRQRYIYIHGTPDDQPMGVAQSHGCIRLHPPAMLQLFAQTAVDMRVWISED